MTYRLATIYAHRTLYNVPFSHNTWIRHRRAHICFEC